MKKTLTSCLALAGALVAGTMNAQPLPSTPGVDTNLYIVAAGTYAGLFYEPDAVRHETSGWLQCAVSRRGTFSGRLILGAKSRVFSGRFDPDGTAFTSLRLTGGTKLDMRLILQTNTSQITGIISNATFVAEILADKVLTYSSTHPCPQAGRYTLLINPHWDGVSEPAGTGYGVATVGSRGTVMMLGTLPDGRVITQTSFVATNGVWPLYERHYGNRGSLLGWINFEDRPTNDFNGRISWTRPGIKGGRIHSGGFTNDALVEGSRYVAPPTATNSVLNFTNGLGIVAFSGGNTAGPFTNAVTLMPRAKVTNESTNRLQMNFNLPWGRFVGLVREPGTGALHHFKGAVLQKACYGAGFFIDRNASGRVYLGPVPEPEPEPEPVVQP
jgi:hypothetical protein